MLPHQISIDPSTTSQLRHSHSEPRLHGRWLLVARVAWCLVLALALVFYVGLIPVDFADAHILCATSGCHSHLTPDKARELYQLGLTLNFYALYGIGLTRLLDFGALAIGVLLFWRKSEDFQALLTSCTLITFGATVTHTGPVSPIPLFLALLLRWMAFFGSNSFGLTFCLFPSGQFVPRWTRWLAVLWVAYWAWNDLVLHSFTNTTGLNGAIFFGLLASLVIIQGYRYRHVSTSAQRQQTKWVVYGLTVALVGFIISVIVLTSVPLGIIIYLIISGFPSLFLLVIPLTIGVAILRYRLWDIDILINRTLVYSALTASVIALYILVVGYLGTLFRTGGNLVISLIATGLLAVLFQPLRDRLQRGVPADVWAAR